MERNDYALVIDGQRVPASATFDVVNPATEEVFAQAPDASRSELDRAVDAARRAFPAWAAMPLEKRRERLVALGEALLAQAEPLSRLLTREQGKPIAEARMEVMGSGHWLIGAASLELPITVNEDSEERVSETRHVPIGVVGAIAAWNFPLLLAAMKIGPALLAGNTMVLKPSPFTPLTTLAIGEIASGILAPGVLNVVTGGDQLGPWMTTHPGIDKISFTGSTATGRKVLESAAPTLKRVTLELGGNDAAIVLPDVDVAQVAEKLFWSAFGNCGQVCIATKRLYIHSDIYETLKDALVTYARTVKVGNGADDGTQIGPINNKAQYERVLALLEDAKQKGIKFATGDELRGGPGYFLPITILDNPPDDASIVQEEQFGPILPLLRFNDDDEVIRRVNATDFGLAGSVWGKDEGRALAIAKQVASGTVWINHTQHLSPNAAFGGMKQSGIGVEGGLEGLLEYTHTQTIVQAKQR
jgi:acyl-CoA reductase-like NAD-dependent aldehyde dehydrogenase